MIEIINFELINGFTVGVLFGAVFIIGVIVGTIVSSILLCKSGYRYWRKRVPKHKHRTFILCVRSYNEDSDFHYQKYLTSNRYVDGHGFRVSNNGEIEYLLGKNITWKYL
jgi:hypothetical protein